MNNISMQQLITLWVELEDAYNNVHGFGGDTAEIYAYTLQPRCPGYPETGAFSEKESYSSHLEMELGALRSLYEVLVLFKKKRECSIFIEGKRLGKWLLKERFHHRFHIQVKAK